MVANLTLPDSTTARQITLASVVISGAPRSYQVVSVPVPDAIAHAGDVVIEIVPRGEFVVLGSRTRTLASTNGRGQLSITIGIPAGALAGRLFAAEARFSSPETGTLVVPIEVDVNLVRALRLRLIGTALHAQAGNDVVVPFEVVNAGNSQESVETELMLPTGWTSRELKQGAITLLPGEITRRKVRVMIPALSNTGSAFIRIDLRQKDETLASENLTVEVFNSSSIGRESGPTIMSAVSQAGDENGRPNTVVSLSATGALYDSVRIDARISRSSALGAAATNAFAHLGTFQSSASLVLAAPTGELSLGNTGTSFSDLTGLYPYGQGGLLHLQHPEWGITAFGALSLPQAGFGKREPMLGFRGDRRLGDVLLSSSISHLAETGASSRKLDAVGVGAAIPAFFGSTLKGEIANRRFLGGSGLGWSTELVRTGTGNNEDFRITHAPGGSDAFARATNELVASLSERVTRRGLVSGSAWRTTDATAVFAGLNSSGFSLRPQYSVLGSTTLSLDARSYIFDATSRPSTGNSGGFGSREQEIGVGLSTYLRQYYVNSAGYLGNVTRTVSPAGQPMLKDRTPRNYWMTNAGWSGPTGLVELETRIEQTRDRSGFVSQQNMFGVRGEQVVLPWLGGIRGEGDLQRVSGFGDQHSSIVRAGLAIPIMNGMAFRIDAERNSIFHSASGHVPWIIGARFEHALRVPMLRTPGSSGYVYEDLNANQRRDRGEPGVPGAIVRRGGETAVADASGKYRVGGDSRQPLTLDETSLPDGWSPAGAARNDLGVSLSTSAEVQLIVAPRSGFSDVQVDLSKAHVIARDSAGREWGARMTGPNTATFESLPVGTYTLEFDLSELEEPLVPRAPVPALIVTGMGSKAVSVTLDPRPIRMWNGPSSHGGTKPSPGAPHS